MCLGFLFERFLLIFNTEILLTAFVAPKKMCPTHSITEDVKAIIFDKNIAHKYPYYFYTIIYTIFSLLSSS